MSGIISFLLRPLNRLANTVAAIGQHPDDPEEIRLQKSILVRSVVFAGIPVHIFILILTLVYDEATTAVLLSIFALLSLTNVIHLAHTRRHFGFFKVFQLAIPMVSPFLGTLALGGIADAGFCIMWAFITPLVAIIYFTPRQVVYWYFAFFFLVIIAALLEPFLRNGNHFPEAVVNFILVFNILGLSSVVFAGMVYFLMQRDEAFRLLAVEREKAESLLINILPKDIAAILKDNKEVIADHYEGASILFADVVDFTSLSSRLTPAELVRMLNEIFSHFDGLVEELELEKIKTIGDCYMVAAGVPRPRADHAQALARLAIGMLSFVNSRQFHGNTINLRIGINSGPVVAGVIGRKKFIYDLWGDAVNTASRMESNGRPGLIQITRTTYELIKNDFGCEPLGVIPVKGKGEMEIWGVNF